MNVSPFFEREWEDLRRRVQRTAGCLGAPTPEMAEELRNQAHEFARRPPPRSHSEILARVAEAAELANGWRKRCGQAPRLIREHSSAELVPH